MSQLLRLTFVLLALLGASLAQADPPARIGRLSLIENGVTFRVDRDDQGGPASINWPISSGAILATERRGRAEVWIGSTAYRLASNSQLAFPLVNDRQVNVELISGSLTVSILDRDQSDDVTVMTPEGRITFASPGRYRIDLRPDHSDLTTQAGRASFNDGNGNISVAAGEKTSFYGNARIRVAIDVDQDAFDHWVAERENTSLSNQARHHVSPAMTGAQDLDAYGDWQTQPEYGAVWYPRAVAEDWAPYRFGRWAWVAPWGWTWIDQAPWGFAPFHYGRWVHTRGRWGWAPGTYVARPVYAPALVAWIGNPGWNANFSFGAAPAVGWFPLAPREVYVPSFRASPAYVHQVNVTHIRDTSLIDRAMRSGAPTHYEHRALPQAVTVIPSRLLHEGRPIGANEFSRSKRRELEQAPHATSAPNPALQPSNNMWPSREGRDEHRTVDERRLPLGSEMPRREASPPTSDPREADNRRGNFRRETPAAPPAMTPLPIRPQEVFRSEPERRPQALPQPIPQPAPQALPALRPAEPATRPPALPGNTSEMDGRRGGFPRDSGSGPREMSPNRPPEVQRSEPERRPLQQQPVPPPQVQAAPRPLETIGNPALAPVREMQHPEREIVRPMDNTQRPREMAPPAPQASTQPSAQPMPQPMRAPMPQAAPPPPPVREAPRIEQRPPEQQRAGNHEGNPDRRRERGDERGQRQGQ